MNRSTSVVSRAMGSAVSVAFVAMSVLAGGAAHAQSAALVQGNGIAITPADMRADSERMPPEMRDLVLSDVRKASQIAENLYVRRALAQRALQAGLDKDPVTAAAIQVARDKILSDALLVQMDDKSAAGVPSMEGMARNIYKASPERFVRKEQVHVRHILLTKEGDNARADAEAVLKKLQGGADFAALAKELSKDTRSAAKGGDLGMFERGRMLPEFDAAAFALSKPGELSAIVDTKFGFHILQLVEKKPEGTQAYEEVRDTLIQEVRGKIAQEARMAVVQEIQKGAKPDAAAIESFASQYKPSKK